MPLDALYGAGAFAGLSAAVHSVLPGASITQSDTPSGVYVQLAWTSATGPELCRMECHGRTVHFAYLSTTCNANPARRETGANPSYAALCQSVGAKLKSFGVAVLTAGTLDAASTTTLLSAAGGFKAGPDPAVLTWVL